MIDAKEYVLEKWIIESRTLSLAPPWEFHEEFTTKKEAEDFLATPGEKQ